AFHSTLQVDGAEQNPLDEAQPFAMQDRRRAESLSWRASPDDALFVGRHHGYEDLPAPAVHTRELELDGPRRSLRILDTVSSASGHELTWTFPLSELAEVADGGEGHAGASFAGGVRLELEAPGLS